MKKRLGTVGEGGVFRMIRFVVGIAIEVGGAGGGGNSGGLRLEAAGLGLGFCTVGEEEEMEVLPRGLGDRLTGGLMKKWCGFALAPTLMLVAALAGFACPPLA